jgi:hypothetical protein
LSIGAPNELRGDEQRRSPRHRALLGGRLAYGGGYFTLGCLVRDLSEHGARIKVPEGQTVPSTLYFLELRSGAVYEARVAWRSLPEIGLEFVRPCNLNDHENQDLMTLRALWAESRERSGI